MNEELLKRLRELEIEDMIWIVLIGIILLSFVANSYERDYLIRKNECSKRKYRELMIFIFSVAFLTYFYYFMDSIRDIRELKIGDSFTKRQNTYLSFVSSALIVVAGAILWYIAYTDEDIETEIAFN